MEISDSLKWANGPEEKIRCISYIFAFYARKNILWVSRETKADPQMVKAPYRTTEIALEISTSGSIAIGHH